MNKETENNLINETDETKNYPRYTKDMVKDYKVLVPNMAPIQFSIIAEAMKDEGYNVEILNNGGPEVAQEGLKYVHNDTCYPALLVIGQFIDALKSGKYDVDHTALILTQTGGGCRASNYIHLLRKALVKAGFPQVPVASLNFSGLEKDSGLQLTIPLIRKLIAGVFYGDLIMLLANQTRPYENTKGQTDALVKAWVAKIAKQYDEHRGVNKRDTKKNFEEIAADFAAIPVTRIPRVKVGIVGEIYVKYSPLGNNHLEEFLANEGCEVNMPGLMGFLQYCIVNTPITNNLYGGSKIQTAIYNKILDWLEVREKMMIAAVKKYPQFHAPALFKDMMHMSDGIIGKGNKMGEGWLLTSEMMELNGAGYENIVCAQPFGCLPNHICGKGMINKIRAIYPNSNITPIDYDPSATRVNQENRIKLMLSVARERLENGDKNADSAAHTAEPLYGKVENEGAKVNA